MIITISEELDDNSYLNDNDDEGRDVGDCVGFLVKSLKAPTETALCPDIKMSSQTSSWISSSSC